MKPGLFAVLCLALLAPPAAAAPKNAPDPAASAREEAKQHFALAEAALAANRYDEAIAEYRAAYELVPRPGFLFNLGQAYRLKGDSRSALDFYKKYLAADPKGKAAPIAAIQIRELTKKVAEADAAEAARKAEADRLVEEQRKADEAKRAKSRKAFQDGPTEPPGGAVGPSPSPAATRPARKGRGLRIAGLVTGGAGVVMIGAGIAFGMKASGLADEVAEQYDPDKVDEGESAESTAIILYVAGGAALVGGTVMYFLGRRAGRERVAVVPSVSQDQVALTAWGTF